MDAIKGPDLLTEQDFCQLVDAWQTPLLRLCYLHLQDRTLAEDAVQETFFKAYRTLDTFRGECSAKTWLTRIAINTCRDQLRSRWLRYINRRVTPELLPEQGVSLPEDVIDLNMAVMALPMQLREVILLYYYQDMSMPEIAAALEISVSTVHARLKKAEAKLRKALKGGDDHE